MTFNEFIKNFNLKNIATSNIKIHEVLKKNGARLRDRYLLERRTF